ncbi:hypothetical protein [Pseudorhodobacter sp.]|uniref:hypothetical protein n=1 Tax=Pseudorhodobacter sp. TaxID=1934400 RepID=UPI003463C465
MTEFPISGTLIGRVWNPHLKGPGVITLREGRVIEITSVIAPRVRDICEIADPAPHVTIAETRDLGVATTIAANPTGPSHLHFLAPCALNAIKACGVTFAGSMRARAALLLSKAKDNNASTAIGPMIRLFDAGFRLDDVRRAALELTVIGADGFEMRGSDPDDGNQPRSD